MKIGILKRQNKSWYLSYQKDFLEVNICVPVCENMRMRKKDVKMLVP